MTDRVRNAGRDAARAAHDWRNTEGQATTAPVAPRAATGDIPVEEFRQAGHALVEWIADYISHPERYPVLSRVAPGDIRNALPAWPPERGEPVDAAIADFERTILPGITHWNHPGFFGYFAVTGSMPGILGELLTAALNVNGMVWRTSPSATELEQVVLDWLRQMLGLPAGWFGMITDTASISTLLALAAAREARSELAIRERGMAGRDDLPVLRIYASEQAHSSVDKAAIALGIGHTNVVRVGVDDEFRLRPDLLAQAIADDRAAGRIPLAVVATVGTTSTTSVDPVRAVGEICRREGAWLHVDGAYAGMAAISPARREILDGIELADSFVTNPHKWLFTPVDCSALYVARPDVLRRAFVLVPEYLTTREQDVTVNYMDYGVQLGRRFRALKLWMVIRAFGREGIASRLEEHMRLARTVAEWVRAEPGWRVEAPVPFSTVCFRCAPEGMSEAEADAWNERALERVNASGVAFLSHTRLRGRYVLRLSIGHLRTTEAELRRAWEVLRAG
ncbi:MAG TPA: pyridoxal-dependent decarboxylase [Gemmatimonadaceae bacterium]|nr:pyridoxal-dependent decarboxylase [Gemmatimonadaceae bacterium]